MVAYLDSHSKVNSCGICLENCVYSSDQNLLPSVKEPLFATVATPVLCGRPPLQSLWSLYSLAFSHDQQQVVAVVALRVKFNSTFERSPKTRRVIANRWSALHRNQNDCNGGWPVKTLSFIVSRTTIDLLAHPSLFSCISLVYLTLESVKLFLTAGDHAS